MISCSKCGAEYEERRVFCGKCRNRMGNPCSRCGFGNGLDDRYCGQCGRSLNVSGMDPEQSSKGTGEQGNRFLFYDELLSEAQKDKEFVAGTNAIMNRDAIKELFEPSSPDSGGKGIVVSASALRAIADGTDSSGDRPSAPGTFDEHKG